MSKAVQAKVEGYPTFYWSKWKGTQDEGKRELSDIRQTSASAGNRAMARGRTRLMEIVEKVKDKADIATTVSGGKLRFKEGREFDRGTKRATAQAVNRHLKTLKRSKKKSKILSARIHRLESLPMLSKSQTKKLAYAKRMVRKYKKIKKHSPLTIRKSTVVSRTTELVTY